MSDRADFFVAGGTLRPNTPSYVTRPADKILYESALEGEFCYVLTPRQMGKSSLMVQTERRLRAEGVATVIIDLTGIGTVPVNEWYLGLLTRLASGLRLKIDVQGWWESQTLNEPDKFMTFLREVALAEVDDPIVIFIDEIDSTLKLDFRDDFFAMIRALYNERANDPIYDRLTFVLLGVATPTDLIQDRERTPFNIGRRIMLKEFSYADAQELREGLNAVYPGQGDAILFRIFYWTSGHPYLTQRLCLAAINDPAESWDDESVDALVEAVFLGRAGRKDTNLTFVQDRIQASSPLERRRILKLYRQVHGGKAVEDDDRSLIQNYLELFGMVRVELGKLGVRNEIYRNVFDQDWIKINMPTNTRLLMAIGAVALVIVVTLVAINALWEEPAADRARFYMDMFDEEEDSDARVEALAGLFDLGPGYEQEALKRFYGLPAVEQDVLFMLDNPQSRRQRIRSLVEGVYLTLDTMPGGRDRVLMNEMIRALRSSDIDGNADLIEQLDSWVRARELIQEGRYVQAIVPLSNAIVAHEDHPVIHYDRAMAYIDLEMWQEALSDLEEILRIAKTAPPTPTPAATTDESIDPTSTSTSTATATDQPVPAGSSTFTVTVGAGLEEPLTPGPSLPDQPATDSPETEAQGSGWATYPGRFTSPDQLIETVSQLWLEYEELESAYLTTADQYVYIKEFLFPGEMDPFVPPTLTSTPTSGPSPTPSNAPTVGPSPTPRSTPTFGPSPTFRVITTGPSPTPIRIDDREPNDDLELAATIPVGSTLGNLTFWPEGDVDFFVFWAKANREYEVRTELDAGLDSYMRVFGPAGLEQLLGENDDVGTGNWGSQVRFTAEEDGLYYIELTNRDPTDALGKTYWLDVVEMMPVTITPTPGVYGADAFEPNYDFDHASILAAEVWYDNLNFVPWGGSDPDEPDNDFYRIWVKPGLLYTCETLDLSPGTDTNLILYLEPSFDADGVGNDDRAPGDFSSLVEWYSTYTGWLYIVVGPSFSGIPAEILFQFTYSLRCSARQPITPTLTRSATPTSFPTPFPTIIFPPTSTAQATWTPSPTP